MRNTDGEKCIQTFGGCAWRSVVNTLVLNVGIIIWSGVFQPLQISWRWIWRISIKLTSRSGRNVISKDFSFSVLFRVFVGRRSIGSRVGELWRWRRSLRSRIFVELICQIQIPLLDRYPLPNLLVGSWDDFVTLLVEMRPRGFSIWWQSKASSKVCSSAWSIGLSLSDSFSRWRIFDQTGQHRSSF